MTAKIRWAMLALAVAGLGLSLESLWVHYNLVTDPTYVSPCNINASFNCSEVYQSAYGSVAGIPVAFGGVIWFGLVALLTTFGSPSAKTSRVAHYVLGLSTIGLAVIAYLAYVSFLVLGTGCVLCMGTYLCVLAIGGLSWLATSGSLGTMLRHLTADVAALPSHTGGFATGVVFGAAVLWGIANFPQEGAMAQQAADGSAAAISASAREDFARAWADQPRVDLGIPADGASVVIAKFNDFECPTCRQAEMLYRPVLQRFEAAHPGAVRYVLKDYPLNASCNFGMQSTIVGHEASCAASAAARIARDRGQYEQMAAWIWANQGTRPEALIDNATRILGLGDGEFDRLYLEQLPAIRQDVSDGAALNITGTPTFFVNGVRLPNAIIPVQYFELAIELELDRATASASAAPQS